MYFYRFKLFNSEQAFEMKFLGLDLGLAAYRMAKPEDVLSVTGNC